MLTGKRVLTYLEEADAVRVGGHFVYASGRHGSAYVNKDAVYTRVKITDTLCLHMALQFADDVVDTVVGPVVGGVILAQGVARHLADWGRRNDVRAIFAERQGRGFRFGRGYDRFVAGRRVLVVEDVLTTGGTAKRVAAAVRRANGNLVGLSALVNRGGVTAADADVPILRSLGSLPIESWAEEECPLCAKGVPVDVDVGKGRQFLSRKAGHPA